MSFLFGPMQYEVAVEGRTARAAGNGEVTLLADGWELVPLAPADGGLLSASVDGQASPLVLRDGQLQLLLTGPGKKQVTVTLEAPVTVEDGARRFTLPLVPAPLSLLKATLPESRLGLDLAGAMSVRSEEQGWKTTVQGTFAGRASATVVWRPRPPEGDGAPARFDAETTTLATVRDGLLRVRATTGLQISGGPLTEACFVLAPDATPLGATGPRVVRWDVAMQEGAKRVTVHFDPPVEQAQTIVLDYEVDLPDDGGNVVVPLTAVVGARRDRGAVGIESATRLEVRPAATTKAERIGVSELPAALRSGASGALQLAYRYATPTTVIGLALTKPERAPARVYAYAATRVAVDASSLRCQAEITYTLLQAGMTTFRIGLPADVTVLEVTGDGIRQHGIVTEGDQRLLVVDLTDVALQRYRMGVTYERRFDAPAGSAEVPLLTHPDAVQERGSVGIEVQGGLEVTPTLTGAERIDVSELPAGLWGDARAPLLHGFSYEATGARIALAVTRHADLAVLMAMCDTCEVATTIAPDGQTITKAMYVVRNNLKPFMALRLPEGAQVWSVFVDDRPVTPVRNAAGEVLVPLRKSVEVDPDDADYEESYAARRNRRRAGGAARAHAVMQQAVLDDIEEPAPGDLKPYDVELVYVGPAVEMEKAGPLSLALPATDIPVGLLAWAVFVPTTVSVRGTAGTCQAVSRFDLPFQHFAEAQVELAQAAAMQKLAEAAEQLQDAQQRLAELAEAAKAQGVLPVRVELPISGTLHRFQKLLTVGEAPTVELQRRAPRWW